VIVSAELLSRAGYSFTWWGWFAWFGIPTVAAVILTSLGHWMWLRPQALAEPEVEQSGLEPQDRHLLTAVGAMVLLWLVGPRFGVTTTAGALAGMGLVAWVTRAPRDWLRDLDWDLILFVGATLSLAHIIEGSGLATWAGASATTWARHLEGSRLLLPGLLSFFVLLRLPLHNGIGYSAIVIPVALAMGSLGSIDVLGVAFVSILASSITFLPVQSTPAMLSHVRQPAPAGAYAVSGLLTFVSVLLVVQFLLDPWWGFLSHGP
jgi:di/tricarboxylate transporter